MTLIKHNARFYINKQRVSYEKFIYHLASLSKEDEDWNTILMKK